MGGTRQRGTLSRLGWKASLEEGITNNMFGWKYDPASGSWPSYRRIQGGYDFQRNLEENIRQYERRIRGY